MADRSPASRWALTAGAGRAALCHFQTQRVYSLNQTASAIAALLRRLRDDDAAAVQPAADHGASPARARDRVSAFPREHEKLGIGRPFWDAVSLHEMRQARGRAAAGVPGPVEIGLDFIWLETTARCTLRCVHCYASSDSAGSDLRHVHLLASGTHARPRRRAPRQPRAHARRRATTEVARDPGADRCRRDHGGSGPGR